jgi:predicted transcriptional regulator
MSATAIDDEPQHRSSRPFYAYASAERAVLSHLLDQHPRRFTLQELAHEVGSDIKEKAVRRAVDNLAAAQFIRREGAAVTPAPAVINFDRKPTTTNF